jgi:uncharacterized protein YxjI
MERLANLDALAVRQKKEWGEIMTGFETRNNYAVHDETGRELYAAGEVGGNFLVRAFLKAYRPFTLRAIGLDGAPVMELRRPFRFYFHEASIVDASGTVIGTIEKQFSILRRVYSVMDRNGTLLFTLFGPLLHPWTFEIQRDGLSMGKISKKWTGLGKEMFTDADNFGITFPTDIDVPTKAILLGAVFLIDFVHFENKADN